jgi:ribonuclease HI
MKEITIYCDGSAIGNPGPGGWGAVILKDEVSLGRKIIELGGSEKHTTNNRMELTAAIEAIASIKGEYRITVKTDSAYVVNGMSKWVFGWERNGWRTATKGEVLNKDLWQKLMKEVSKRDVEWEHVSAHTGILMNERVDVIANSFARGEKIKLFEGDERTYKQFLEDAPKARIVSKSAKAYSYVSMVDGKIMTHSTWKECEARVQGQKARFKKSVSFEDERAIIEDFKKKK